MKRLFLLPLLTVVAFLTGCEKDITVDLIEAEEKIIVEGYITPGMPAYVFLSRTAPYFAPTDSASLLNYVVKDAIVTISDGTITDTLIAPAPGIGYLYISTLITGEVGKNYTLTARLTDGRSISSVTTIPVPVPLDSLWFKVRAVNDNRGWAYARLSDPSTSGNSYRWYAKRLNQDVDFIAPLGSVFEDKFFNGLTFDFAASRGNAPYTNDGDNHDDNDGYFLIGDTIIVKFASTTREGFEFWRSAESQVASGGSPFASPTPLKSNITGGIGIWEGYSFTIDTLIAQ